MSVVALVSSAAVASAVTVALVGCAPQAGTRVEPSPPGSAATVAPSSAETRSSSATTQPEAIGVPSDARGATGSSANVEASATATDLEAARRAILAHEPGYAKKYGPLRGDPGTRADLVGAEWWATHREAPFKSLRLWAEVLHSDAPPGEAVAHMWDVVQVTPDSKWTVILESDSTD